jgi:hypothetical protein
MKEFATFLFYAAGLYSGYLLYRDIKTKPRFRKALYWSSAVLVPMVVAYVAYLMGQA